MVNEKKDWAFDPAPSKLASPPGWILSRRGIALDPTHFIYTWSSKSRAHAGLATGLYQAGAASICHYSHAPECPFVSGS